MFGRSADFLMTLLAPGGRLIEKVFMKFFLLAVVCRGSNFQGEMISVNFTCKKMVHIIVILDKTKSQVTSG